MILKSMIDLAVAVIVLDKSMFESIKAVVVAHVSLFFIGSCSTFSSNLRVDLPDLQTWKRWGYYQLKGVVIQECTLHGS